ncbi:MAG: hypothetical protein IEMM0002_0355 [bacterium]|nr:MAG: hypothetical protein IEMM0002_0355 [bacterium]
MKIKLSALIIDDNPADANILGRYLQELKIWYVEYAVAQSGMEALEKAGESAPDVIFVDYHLGAETGTDVIRSFKEAGSRAAFILLTGMGGEKAAVEALREGACDYLAKSDLSPEMLERSLRHVTERRRAENKLQRARDELEIKIKERTAELSKANVLLKAEIIDRKEGEEAIKEAHKENEQLLSAMPSILIGLNSVDMITKWNKAAEKTFDVPADGVTGKVFPQCGIKWDWDKINKILTLCKESGQSIAVDDISYTRPDGKTGFLSITITPLLGDSDTFDGILLLGTDITESKTMESQLAQAQKLESIGLLAAGIAHEINTPTQFVGDNISFIQKAFNKIDILFDKYSGLLAAAKEGTVNGNLINDVESVEKKTKLEFLREEVPKAVQSSLRGVERVSTIVRAMKEFSHPGTKEKVPTDINKAIKSTITVSRNEWKYVAEMVTDLDKSLPLVPCLPADFNQVILNLITNAADAIRSVVKDMADNKGTITIKTCKNGDATEIRISDTGTGIPAEIRNKIFDPFFTTKEVGKGTGQGLPISHSVIVDKLGGTITFQSEKGKGTTFTIRLPLGLVENE